ncbi:MAG: aryl-sulfate sulfotransferase [Flavobacteriaceae bacterium]
MKKQIFYIIITLFFIGCNDDLPIDKTITISSIIVENASKDALVANVLFNTNQAVSGIILYWNINELESTAKQSIIGSKTTSHTIPLLNLSESSTYNYRIKWQENDDVSDIKSFTTSAVPLFVKEFYNQADNVISEENEGYFLFHNKVLPACMIVVDNTGKMIWYRTSENKIQMARVTVKGTLLTIEDDLNNNFATGNMLIESAFGGEIISKLKKDTADVNHYFHHDAIFDENGNSVVLTEVEVGGLPGEGVEVFNPNGQKIWEWNSFDGSEVPQTYVQPWANSISIDNQGDYIVSFRGISQIWKIDSTSGNVIWKLGTGGDYTLDGNASFLYQHYASEFENGKILMFDNGGVTERPTSRLLELSLDDTAMTAITTKSHYLSSQYFSPYMGSVKIMNNNDMLIASATNGKILMLNSNGSLKWELSTVGKIYRVEHFTGLFN